MRLSPPLTVIGVVGMTLAITATLHGKETHSRQDMGCLVALAVLDREITEILANDSKRKFAVSNEPDDSTFGLVLLQKLAWSADRNANVQQNVELYHDLIKSGRTSPVESCANIRAYLEAKKIPYGAAAVDHAIPGGMAEYSEKPFPSAIIMISQPAISQDLRKAVVTIGVQYAPLAGSGKLVEVDMQGQSIKVTKEFGTWVS